MRRIAIVLCLLVSSRAHAESAKRDELAAVGGVMLDGAYIDQRICSTSRAGGIAIGCAHFVNGTQHDHYVFDLAFSAGVHLRRGRYDLTSTAGVSYLNGLLGVVDLIAWPFGQAAPADKVLRAFPISANANVAVGYTIVSAGRFRLRADAGAQAFVPIVDDTIFKIDTPHGIAGTFGLGASY